MSVRISAITRRFSARSAARAFRTEACRSPCKLMLVVRSEAAASFVAPLIYAKRSSRERNREALSYKAEEERMIPTAEETRRYRQSITAVVRDIYAKGSSTVSGVSANEADQYKADFEPAGYVVSVATETFRSGTGNAMIRNVTISDPKGA